jgi:hypothetical protein
MPQNAQRRWPSPRPWQHPGPAPRAKRRPGQAQDPLVGRSHSLQRPSSQRTSRALEFEVVSWWDCTGGARPGSTLGRDFRSGAWGPSTAALPQGSGNGGPGSSDRGNGRVRESARGKKGHKPMEIRHLGQERGSLLHHISASARPRGSDWSTIGVR